MVRNFSLENKELVALEKALKEFGTPTKPSWAKYLKTREMRTKLKNLSTMASLCSTDQYICNDLVQQTFILGDQLAMLCKDNGLKWTA